MPVTLTYEMQQAIRTDFQQMKTLADFRQLLNRMVDLRKEEVAERRKRKQARQYPVYSEQTNNILKRFNAHKENITEAEFSFFATSFKDENKKRKRYTSFTIPKKSGGQREIKAPVEKLKNIQAALNLLLQIIYPTQSQAYGFVPGKSIKDNAAIHAGAAFVLNVDLKDFFPSIPFGRIKKVLELAPFNLNGEREKIAFTIANLCTEDGVLPQGAPTSPILTNIICQSLDRKLSRLAIIKNAKYSRYADDITFSCSEFIFTKKFKSKLVYIISQERFTLNEEKTRLQGKAYRQEVTGLTVNEKVNINRHYLRSYRTLLHLYKTNGAEAALEYHYKRMPEALRKLRQEKQPSDISFHIKNVIKGKYQFIKMIVGDEKLKPPFKTGPVAQIIQLAAEAKIKVPEIMLEKLRLIQSQRAATELPTPPTDETKKVVAESITSIVLNKWEDEGFESAIAIFKKHLDEK